MPQQTVALRVTSADQLEHPNVNLSEARWRFLCEGDSWFTIGALNPIKSANLLQHLRFSQICWAINCGYPGDTLARMVERVQDKVFTSLLANAPRRIVRPWDALLVSAGGNDLIDALNTAPEGAAKDDPSLRVLLTSAEWGNPALGPSRYVSESGFARFEAYVRANVLHLVALRDSEGSESKGVPIFMHGYALPTPREAGAGLKFGPWLKPALVRYGIPDRDWTSLAAHLLRRLARALEDCAADPQQFPNLHVFHSLDGLGIVPAHEGDSGDSGDWVNEIHLNASGCEKLATGWSQAIEAVMVLR